MGEFIAALISGVVSMLGTSLLNKQTHNQNVGDWNMQNRYNEDMYNRYNNPSSRVEQLKAAGMSDAAIGQALAGFTGSGTTVQSSPLQPTDLSSLMSSMFGNVNDSLRFGNETVKNRSDIDLQKAEKVVQNLTAEQIRKNIQKASEEIDNLKIQYDLNQEQFWYIRNFNDKMLEMTDMQMRKLGISISQDCIELLKSYYSRDVAKYEAALSNFKREWLRITSIPYEDYVFNKDPLKLVEVLVKMIGGTQIDEDNVFKEYSLPASDSNYSVNVYGRNYRRKTGS